MKAEVREALGEVAYEASKPMIEEMGLTRRNWQQADAYVREMYCIEAEEVVRQLAAMIGVPILQLLLSEDDVKSILEQV